MHVPQSEFEQLMEKNGTYLFGGIGAGLTFIILIIAALMCVVTYIREKNSKLQKVVILKTAAKPRDSQDSDMTIGCNKTIGQTSTPFFDEPEVTGTEEIKIVKANVGDIMMDR